MQNKPTIVLDRDGIINYESAAYIKTPDEWRAIPGSLEAIAALNQAGFRVLVATNQSGVARGLYDLATLSAIHDKMHHALHHVGGSIAGVFVCPHHPSEGCACRKPGVGLFRQMEVQYSIQWKDTFFVGDRLSDWQAAQAIGCRFIMIQAKPNPKEVLPEKVPCFASLQEAVPFILEHVSHELL